MKTENPYKEAMRYIDNAREILKRAGRDGKFYKDVKYVQSACGIAYLGALKALDFLFDIKKVPKKRGRKSIEYYQYYVSTLDKKLLNHLNEAYHVLHLEGYYGDVKSFSVIEAGFEQATSIISSLKPFSKNGVGKK